METVYFGLDFETFNQYYPVPVHENFVEKRLLLPLYIKDLFSTLLSRKAIQDSIKVIGDNYHHTMTFTDSRFKPDGSISETNVIPEGTDQFTLEQLPKAYVLSQQSIGYLKEISDLCLKNEIRLVAYISPVHAIVLESFWQNGLWQAYEEWERALVAVIPFWDFSGYHPISMSSLHNQENYNDLSHFSRKIGDLIVSRLTSPHTEAVPEYFGVEVTSQNVDSHLNVLKASRERWPHKGQNLLQLLIIY